MKDKYDAIIIGAGIGGLVCGCYLAKAGMKVLIVEKNDKAGGCCVSFRRNGIRFDAGAHIFGSCNKGGTLYNILKRLDIKQEFVRLNPVENFFFADDKFEAPDDIDVFIVSLQRNFSNEKTNIMNFFEELIKISRNIKNGYKKYAKVTYQDFLDKYFKEERLKSILSAQAGYLGIVPREISTVAMCAMLSSYLKDGAYYPLGGASSFSNKLMAQFKFFGGNIIFNMMVTKLIIKNNRISGVLVSDDKGRKNDIYSDIVVSNIDITYTFFDLMNPDLVSDTVRKNMECSKETPSLSILYLGLRLTRKIIEEKIGWHYPDYDVNKSLDECIYVSSPSLYDNTAAPEGINIIEAFQIAKSPESEDKSNWKVYKKKIEKKMLEKLINTIPEIKDSIVVQECATPETIEHYTLNKNGSAYGWSLKPGQFDRNKAINSALNGNLYLTGHWTNPGGGILAVAISGYNIAKKVLSNYEKVSIRNY